MEKRLSGVTNCTNGIKVVQITQGDVSATKWVLDRELMTYWDREKGLTSFQLLKLVQRIWGQDTSGVVTAAEVN